MATIGLVLAAVGLLMEREVGILEEEVVVAGASGISSSAMLTFLQPEERARRAGLPVTGAAGSSSTSVDFRRVEVVRCSSAFLAAGVIAEGGGSKSGNPDLCGDSCSFSASSIATALCFVRRDDVVVGCGRELNAVWVAGSSGDSGVLGISWSLSTAVWRVELVRRGSDFLVAGVSEAGGSGISGISSSFSMALFFVRDEESCFFEAGVP